MAASADASLTPFVLSAPVSATLKKGGPVVALESAVITHGLPRPTNVAVAGRMEATVQEAGAVPATIAVVAGEVRVGIPATELQQLADAPAARKLGVRDLAGAVIRRETGGTTVSATAFVAAAVGIRVFATGGIGGVHREDPRDISSDLQVLSKSPVIVVSAGAKSILDLDATLEYLETMGVPVIGFQTDQFPAFYTQESGRRVTDRLESAAAIAEFWGAQRRLGLQASILVANPVPPRDAIPRAEVEAWIEQASQEAMEQEIRGQALTPFLLRRLAELSGGRTLRANEALLLSNAKLAAQIAVAVSKITEPEARQR